ncbi:MAG: hypothetical protein HC945_04070, partial [Nitrosarchaeum sp.]|nr:hypothetical protein [Nitrosarchaeum sp.]
TSASITLLLLTPYLLLNLFLFKNPLHSFITAYTILSEISTCSVSAPIWLFYTNLALMQIPLLGIAALGLIKNGRSWSAATQYSIIAIPVIALFLLSLDCADERYFLLFLPFLLFLLIKGWSWCSRIIPQDRPLWSWWLLLLMIALLWILALQDRTLPQPQDSTTFRTWLLDTPQGPGMSMIPHAALHSDAEIIPLYYGNDRAANRNCTAQTEWILINECTRDYARWSTHCIDPDPLWPEWIKGYEGTRTTTWQGCQYILYVKK